MDPIWLFPLLSAGFAAAAILRGLRSRRWHGAGLTWALMAVIFGAVAVWLRVGP